MLDYIDFADRSQVIVPAPSTKVAARLAGINVIDSGQLVRLGTQGVTGQHGRFGFRHDPVRATCIRDNRNQAWSDFVESREHGRNRPKRGVGDAVRMRAAERVSEINHDEFYAIWNRLTTIREIRPTRGRYVRLTQPIVRAHGLNEPLRASWATRTRKPGSVRHFLINTKIVIQGEEDVGEDARDLPRNRAYDSLQGLTFLKVLNEAALSLQEFDKVGSRIWTLCGGVTSFVKA